MLGYFARDFQELTDSAFMKDGPGSITGQGSSSSPDLETAVSDDEIRSFVTIFRRLYMEKEPANFQKAVDVFTVALADHPLGTWIAGVRASYLEHLSTPPEMRPFVPAGTCTFTVKRLIDVFLYTRYAHQPSHDRQRQFIECLVAVDNRQSLLTWMFLVEVWRCSLEIISAGKIIASWFTRYCQHHGLSPIVLAPVLQQNPGIGTKEKETARKARLLREKCEELAIEIWKENGAPPGGPAQFLGVANEKLNRIIECGAE